MFKKLFKWSDDGRHNEKGEEKLDPTPIEVPIPLRAQETLEVKIARMLRSAQIREDFIRNGIETFEEADDFEVGDDYDPKSPYEQDFDVAGIAAVDKGLVAPPVKPEGFVDPRSKKKEESPPRQPPHRSKFEEEKPSSKKKKSSEEDDE